MWHWRAASPRRRGHVRLIQYTANTARSAAFDGGAKPAERRPKFIVGDGAKRAQVEAASRELPSVRLFPYQPRERLAESLSAGDVHVVTMDARTLGLLEPSKLYGVMAAGRPVLFIGPATSEAARTVVREGVGEVVANGDVDGAVKALGRLLAAAGPLGERARQAFDQTYDRRHRTMALGALLAQVIQG